MKTFFYSKDSELLSISEPMMLLDQGLTLSEQVVFSELNPDWSREHKSFFSWNPSRSLLASLRAYQKCSISTNPIAIILKKFAVLRHHFWSLYTGADIPLNSKISGGLLIPHPNGIVIHPDAAIGPNCIIFQQVTLGTRNDLPPPKIGAHVEIGAGAKILGPINIGNFVKIGANAVVLTDVPDGKTAVGIPATIIN
jgi:serine O-acetyltransferase